MERTEAIKKIRQMSLPKETMEILKALAPELKESEDERTRKEIIHYLDYTAGGLSSEEQHRWIAYLEKQVEASKAIEAVNRIDKYIDEHVANAHDMKDSNPDKKYYRGCDDALGKMSGILQDVYSDEKQKEQKPAEWSEEDLQHKSWILECLADGEKKMPEYAEDFQAAYKWLKSLRPNPHWKPSEEQMEAFRSYIKDFQEKAEAAVGGWNNFDVMIRLFEQLKKLKGQEEPEYYQHFDPDC